jgi:hypothetical protein
VRQAIADPGVRWLDLGALHRTIKAGSLCAQQHPVSTYIRCKSRWVVWQGGVCRRSWMCCATGTSRAAQRRLRLRTGGACKSGAVCRSLRRLSPAALALLPRRFLARLVSRMADQYFGLDRLVDNGVIHDL